jgi:hypothetical protein
VLGFVNRKGAHARHAHTAETESKSFSPHKLGLRAWLRRFHLSRTKLMPPLAAEATGRMPVFADSDARSTGPANAVTP